MDRYFTSVTCKYTELVITSHIHSQASIHSDYDDAVHHCAFGTALVPEGLWSFGDCVMTKRGSSTSPLTFESILYLNFNSDLWDLNDIIEANNCCKNESRLIRLDWEKHVTVSTRCVRGWMIGMPSKRSWGKLIQTLYMLLSLMIVTRIELLFVYVMCV